jgi:hypothetical protein
MLRKTMLVVLSVLLMVLGWLQSSLTQESPLDQIPVDIVPLVEVLMSEPAVEVVPVARISAYNAVPRQTQGDPNVSSCGPNLEKQVAVSRDMFFDSEGRKHLCGTRVSVITNRGEEFHDYVIWDTMAERFTETVDILWHNLNEHEAYAFGITTGFLIIHGD